MAARRKKKRTPARFFGAHHWDDADKPLKLEQAALPKERELRAALLSKSMALDSVAKLLVAHGLHSQATWDPAHLSVLEKALNDPNRGLGERMEINQRHVEQQFVVIVGILRGISRNVDVLARAVGLVASPKIDEALRKLLNL